MKIRRQQRASGTAVTHGSGSLFADLGFSRGESAELKIKAELTRQIYNRIREMGFTQVEAARHLRLSQPDVSKLMNGRHTGYSVERLISLLNALDIDIDIVLRPRMSHRPRKTGRVRVMEAAA